MQTPFYICETFDALTIPKVREDIQNPDYCIQDIEEAYSLAKLATRHFVSKDIYVIVCVTSVEPIKFHKVAVVLPMGELFIKESE